MTTEIDNLTSSLGLALVAGDQASIISYLQKLRALGQGHTLASVAAIYETGLDDIHQQLDVALNWYRKSACEENDPDGYFGLARFYLHGMAVEQDSQRAVDLFWAAYKRGSMEAALMLGRCYLRGLGVKENISQAEEVLRVAATQGYVLAFAMLSKIERERHHYWLAFRLWWRAISEARRLLPRVPKAAQLYGLDDAQDSRSLGKSLNEGF